MCAETNKRACQQRIDCMTLGECYCCFCGARWWWGLSRQVRCTLAAHCCACAAARSVLCSAISQLAQQLSMRSSSSCCCSAPSAKWQLACQLYPCGCCPAKPTAGVWQVHLMQEMSVGALESCEEPESSHVTPAMGACVGRCSGATTDDYVRSCVVCEAGVKCGNCCAGWLLPGPNEWTNKV